MDNAKKKIAKYNEKLIVNGDKVLVAVSGGPDSMCLLHILNEIKQDIGFDLLVAHVNYFLRKDSTEDAMYVENFCKKNKINFFQKEINIEKLAKEKKNRHRRSGKNSKV